MRSSRRDRNRRRRRKPAGMIPPRQVPEEALPAGEYGPLPAIAATMLVTAALTVACFALGEGLWAWYQQRWLRAHGTPASAVVTDVVHYDDGGDDLLWLRYDVAGEPFQVQVVCPDGGACAGWRGRSVAVRVDPDDPADPVMSGVDANPGPVERRMPMVFVGLLVAGIGGFWLHSAVTEYTRRGR